VLLFFVVVLLLFFSLTINERVSPLDMVSFWEEKRHAKLLCAPSIGAMGNHKLISPVNEEEGNAVSYGMMTSCNLWNVNIASY
jgi:hypothetical protein